MKYKKSGWMSKALYLLLFLMLFSGNASADNSCADCHGNADKMEEYGYSQLAVSPEEVRAQTRMPAFCADCHKGNPDATGKEDAHLGSVGIKSNPGIFSYNPVTEPMCRECHADIALSFLKSPMGGGKRAHTRSQYPTWTGPAGPHSCGLWNSQKDCNQCHVGCLDCHYNPGLKLPDNPAVGPHTFSKKPSSVSCYGGASGCHADALEKRRGDGYLREGLTRATAKGRDILKDNKDVHVLKNISCIDCHQPNKRTKHHGDMNRLVNCARCHEKTVTAHAKGLHKKVDCASCHISFIGGNALTFHTAGDAAAGTTDARISDYVSDAVFPLLVKGQKGVWIPVHVVPHITENIKADGVRQSSRLLFRNIPHVMIERRYPSNDSFAITGIVKDADGKDRDTMVWINADRIAHGTGKSRTCESCHASTTQKIIVGFDGGSYKDVESGEYTIIADETSLRVVNFKGPDNDPMPKGLEPFRDKWELKGNYSMPQIKNRKLYESLKNSYEKDKFTH